MNIYQIAVLSILTILSSCAQVQTGTKNKEAEAKWEYFQKKVYAAAEAMNIDGEVVIHPSEEHEPYTKNTVAKVMKTEMEMKIESEGWTKVTIYTLYVSAPMFWDNTPHSVLDHIALHEMCHIARGHFEPASRDRKNSDIELDSENCVRSYVGEERYRASLHAIDLWQPTHALIQKGQRLLVKGLINHEFVD